MSSNTALRWLTMTARHYFELGYQYDQVKSIIWFRNDQLQCNPDDVREMLSRELRAACKRGYLDRAAERYRAWLQAEDSR